MFSVCQSDKKPWARSGRIRELILFMTEITSDFL
jgi:hypothetical protein